MTFTLNIFLAFHNLFMMLVHMEVHLKGYFLMSISLQKYTVWILNQTALNAPVFAPINRGSPLMAMVQYVT